MDHLINILKKNNKPRSQSALLSALLFAIEAFDLWVYTPIVIIISGWILILSRNGMIRLFQIANICIATIVDLAALRNVVGIGEGSS